MLKKCFAIAMLLLMIVSFTIGSVDMVGVSSDKPASRMWRGTFSDGMPLPLLPPMPPVTSGIMLSGGGHGEDTFTNVILDLSGREAPHVGGVSWRAPGFMPPFRGVHMIPANEYIDGKMTVQKPGSDIPSTYSVKFFRHEVHMANGRGAMVTYRANTAIPMDEEGGSFFTFSGEIVVTNDSTRYNNITLTPDDGYTNEITTGETRWHQAAVTGESTSFNFDLKWNNPNDSLRLMVYTPDGHVLGPYTDASDGKADGRISMEVDNSDGVAAGDWLFKVTGTSVSGKDEYYIRTW